MPTTPKIAIIGAGMTGLTCATDLAASGIRADIFDKGRNPGGRMSTRRFDGGAFDHGAQYMRPESEAFASFLNNAATGGHAAIWPATDQPGKPAAFIGQPGTNSLPASLAAHLPVQQSVNIAQVQRTPEGWQLDADDGTTHDTYDHIVITIPAPQTIELLGPYAAPFKSQLEAVTYDRCMVAMIGFETPLSDIPAILKPDTGPIGYIAHESAKPGRTHTLDCWTLHANPAWSLEHQNDEKGSVAADLHTAFCDLIPAAKSQAPAYLDGHRWRYAIVSNAIGQPILTDPSLGITIAGDFMLGPSAEHAYVSGKAAARVLIAA